MASYFQLYSLWRQIAQSPLLFWDLQLVGYGTRSISEKMQKRECSAWLTRWSPLSLDSGLAIS